MEDKPNVSHCSTFYCSSSCIFLLAIFLIQVSIVQTSHMPITYRCNWCCEDVVFSIDVQLADTRDVEWQDVAGVVVRLLPDGW